MIFRLIYIFLIILIFISNGFLADYLINNNPGADIQTYMLGGEDYGTSYFEPFAFLYFESVYLISSLLEYKWLLGVISSLFFSLFLYFKAKCNIHLCIFWLLTLGMVLPLINIRYAIVFMLALFLPIKSVRIISALAHWNLIILLSPINRKQLVRFILFLLPFIFIGFYFGMLNFVFLKMVHYLYLETKVYGVGQFIELSLIAFVFIKIYKQLGVNGILFYSLLALATMSAIFGLPIVAGRIITLALLISLLDLHKTINVKLKSLPVLGLYLIASYEVYRVTSMIGII